MKLLILFIGLMAINVSAQDQLPAEELPAAPVVAKKSKNANMRKREHRISWDYASGKTEIEIEGFEPETTKRSELNFEYGRNWGQFEAGIGYGVGVEDDGEDEVTTSGLTLYGRFNFIENKVGQDVIPYLAVGFQSQVEEYDLVAGDLDAEGNGTAMQLGVTWFPLGEIYAVELAVYSNKISGKIKDATDSADYDLKSSGLSFGYSIYF